LAFCVTINWETWYFKSKWL